MIYVEKHVNQKFKYEKALYKLVTFKLIKNKRKYHEKRKKKKIKVPSIRLFVDKPRILKPGNALEYNIQCDAKLIVSA